MRETKCIPAENQYGKVPFGLPEYPAFDVWRITVRLVFGQTAMDSPHLVKPDLQRKVMNRQIDQAGKKGHSPTRQLSIGQTVMACNYSGKDKWLPGIVRAQTGPLSYVIKVGPNRIWRRHIDQLRAYSVKVNDQSDDTAVSDYGCI